MLVLVFEGKFCHLSLHRYHFPLRFFSPLFFSTVKQIRGGGRGEEGPKSEKETNNGNENNWD